MHETSYTYTDRNGHAKTAEARVLCPFGLSAADELTLWGLLALTFAQPDPQPEFQATPHYCLRALGIIGTGSRKGGKQYQLFRDTIRRLSRVLYENTAFYDPVRGEHRDVAFGVLKYSLPLDASSSRAWRFIWDQQFFDVCCAAKGSLSFDLDTYRRLDHASRRLFVLLQKIFWRNEMSPSFDVRHLAINTLGFSSTMSVPELKARVVRCANRLLAEGIIALPPGAGRPQDLFRKRGVGEYSIAFNRGAYFDGVAAKPAVVTREESPLAEPLRAIGFDDAAIRRLLRSHKASLLQEWADITLAALERNGREFFTSSPQAYFMDNVKHASRGTRTAPDWWRQLRVEEMKREQEERRLIDGVRPSSVHPGAEEAFRHYLDTEAREAFHHTMNDLVAKLTAAGSDGETARERAASMTETHFRHRFRKEHPEWSDAAPERLDLGALLRQRMR